ncbi:MAG: ATP-dependent helicase HrpB [Acidimicrobiales bacterium]|jgi:ATP-dependent helicase HrpB
MADDEFTVLDVLAMPVDEVVPELRVALAEHHRAVLVAEPGAGKTTIVPLRLLNEPWLGDKRIVVLEPRRIAARAAAARMADLLGERVGETVGFTTRDERKVSGRTRIEVVTEGILTRRLQRDPELPGVGLVMFDEFHERNLQADLGLAFALETSQALREDLRILVASATIDSEAVSRLLGGAPVLSSEGRTYPIDIEWVQRRRSDRLEAMTRSAVDRLLTQSQGDILVFLSGAGIIRRVESDLRGAYRGRPIDIRPLYGAMAAEDQDAALKPSPVGRRKIVLATDIAETSLTVEGVTAVVDSGESRTPKFDPRSGMSKLVTGAISKASADQRAGRAGRMEPGRAIRLWSKSDNARRKAHRSAEINQVDLAGFVLESLAWGCADPSELAMLDKAPAGALAEANEVLRLIGALDAQGHLTAIGKRLIELPLHPRLGRMVIAGVDAGLGWMACLMAAALEDRDVLSGRPTEVPADFGLRLALLDDDRRRHPNADTKALRSVRRRARQLADRISEPQGPVDGRLAGGLLIAGFPDRIAQARGNGNGRFRLRSGTGAWVNTHDVLATEELLVAADIEGDRREGRIRIGAAIDPSELDAFGGDVERIETLRWDKHRNDLLLRVERRLGGIELAVTESRPEPGPATTAALVDRARDTRLSDLGWSDSARQLQNRLGFLRHHHSANWPAVNDEALLESIEDWLPGFLLNASRRADLRAVDMGMVLSTFVNFDQHTDLGRLAPTSTTIPSGRSVKLNYDTVEPPKVSARVQELYGTAETPSILDGKMAITFEMLSPAGRPIQVTSDLDGFWQGSWAEVRKEMAAKYPKHNWPADPTTATPAKPNERPKRGR